MLACDLIMEVRASRSMRAEQVAAVERMVFGGAGPGSDEIDLVLAIDRYVERADPCWDDLVTRATLVALSAGAEASQSPAVAASSR